MRVHEVQAVGVPAGVPALAIRDDGQVPEAHRGKERLDVEAEPVGDQRHRYVVIREPCAERRERGIHVAVLQREGQECGAVGAQHAVLRHDRGAQPDLSAINRLVVGDPSPLAEPLQQVLGEVVRARRSVEIHEHRADGRHRDRLYRLWRS